MPLMTTAQVGLTDWGGARMGFGSQETQQQFPFPFDEVYDGILIVLPSLGMVVESEDRVIGRITASARMSAFSWGESLALRVEAIDGTSALVGIESALKVGVNIAGTHRHVQNFNSIISALSSLLQANAESTYGSARIDQLMMVIRDQSAHLRDCGNELPPDDVFELGRAWALLFDETGNPEHRIKALSAMSKAISLGHELHNDPFGEVDDFGSLMEDPEFREFT